MLTLLLIFTTLLPDTAATEAYVQGQYGQGTMLIEGNSRAGFQVGAQSVYDLSPKHRVFGEASYSWQQSRGNRWVENTDYERVYPYLTCDTVGGGLRSEQYRFVGGYRMLLSRWLWYVSMQFRAEQSYRQVDPRPNNKAVDMALQAGGGYIGTTYAVGASLKGGRYKQTNTMHFYSELGECLLYHTAGTRSDYARFTGGQKQTHYHGGEVAGSLWLLPRSKGWQAAAHYSYTTTTNELQDNTYIPLGIVKTHDIAGTVGYLTPLWRLSLHGTVALRRGIQQFYGQVANNYYTPLNEQLTYSQNAWSLSADGAYTVLLSVGRLTTQGSLGYTGKAAHSSLPVNAKLTAMGDELESAQCHYVLSLRYQFPMKNKYGWFVRLEGLTTHYLATGHYQWLTSLSTGLCF